MVKIANNEHHYTRGFSAFYTENNYFKCVQSFLQNSFINKRKFIVNLAKTFFVNKKNDD